MSSLYNYIVSIIRYITDRVLHSYSFSSNFCNLLVNRSKVHINLKLSQMRHRVRENLYVLSESRKSELENRFLSNVSLSDNTCQPWNFISDLYAHSFTDQDILVVLYFVYNYRYHGASYFFFIQYSILSRKICPLGLTSRDSKSCCTRERDDLALQGDTQSNLRLWWNVSHPVERILWNTI